MNGCWNNVLVKTRVQLYFLKTNLLLYLQNNCLLHEKAQRRFSIPPIGLATKYFKYLPNTSFNVFSITEKFQEASVLVQISKKFFLIQIKEFIRLGSMAILV